MDFALISDELGEYFQHLHQMIEETHRYSGQRVVLVAHSLGAPMMAYFLDHHSQHWKDTHIEALVSMAGAWGGAVRAVQVYTAGTLLLSSFVLSLSLCTELLREFIDRRGPFVTCICLVFQRKKKNHTFFYYH